MNATRSTLPASSNTSTPAPAKPTTKPPTLTADELRAWRHTLSVTIARASELLGVSRQAYRKLETGACPIDRRTELACRWLLAKAAGDLDLDANRRFMRAIGRWQ